MRWSRLGTTLLAALLANSTVVFAGDLPNLHKTPGLWRADLTEAEICATKWGKDARHVTAKMKGQVFAAYGYSGNTNAHCLADTHGRHCEIDHLISRELGGADSVRNLWPQPYGSSPWNAHLKDKLENRLHTEMCAHRLTLARARAMLVHDWRRGYRQYYDNP